jgi:uncharacterized protein with GYD domain
MPTYVSLVKLTDQGLRAFKEQVTNLPEVLRQAEQQGIKIHAAFWTQGHYDAIFIAEHPTEEASIASLVPYLAGGNIRTETLRAFSPEEMVRIVQQAP